MNSLTEFLRASVSPLWKLSPAQITLILQAHWTFQDLQKFAEQVNWTCEKVDDTYVFKRGATQP